jgi:hypothetical protein
MRTVSSPDRCVDKAATGRAHGEGITVNRPERMEGERRGKERRGRFEKGGNWSGLSLSCRLLSQL